MDIIGAHLSSGAALLLWILAAILVIAGILSIIRGAILWGSS